MLKFKNKLNDAWKDLAFDFTLAIANKKDTSELVAKASTVYFSKGFNLDKSKISPVIKKLVDHFDNKTTIHLLKRGSDLTYVLDSAKPRTGDNLYKAITMKSASSYPATIGKLFDVVVSGIQLSKKNKVWTVDFAKVHSINPSKSLVVDTVRNILSRAQTDKTLLPPTNNVLTECRLIKFDKLTPEIELSSDVNYTKTITFCKSDNDKRLVYGVVYEPDVVDTDGHFSTAEVIEGSAHDYMADYQDINLMHEQPLGNDIKVVESYIAPIDFSIGMQYVKKGSWVMVVRIMNDELWQAVKDGKLNGFSIEGKGVI